MTSTFARQPRSPTSVNSRPSSYTKCSNATDKLSVKWRTSLYTRRKQPAREGSAEFKTGNSGFQENFYKNEEKRLPEAGKSQLLRSLYIDQQTGEMKLSSTDQAIGKDLDVEGETNHIRRYFPNRRIRSRTQSDTTSPRPSRCVWDQSLKTRSITINSRSTPSSSERFPYLQSAPTKQSVGNLLPRISRSAENIAITSAYEIPTRYPRGQQRPTGLASGHHALLLRHKEIVDASKRTGNLWYRRRKMDSNLAKDPRIADFNSGYLKRAYPSLLRLPERHLASHDIISSQQCCGQEVTSIMKANRKCLEWFNTWVDD